MQQGGPGLVSAECWATLSLRTVACFSAPQSRPIGFDVHGKLWSIHFSGLALCRIANGGQKENLPQPLIPEGFLSLWASLAAQLPSGGLSL